MSTSVRKENRWKKTTELNNDYLDDRKRELEAVFMIRKSRLPIPNIPSCATRQQVRRWMRANALDYDGATQLAEGSNIVFTLPEGAMDDETHWVWDEAFNAIKGKFDA